MFVWSRLRALILAVSPFFVFDSPLYSNCGEVLGDLAKKPRVHLPYSNPTEFRAWLEDNLLLGFEVAVTSQILTQIPNASKLRPDLPLFHVQHQTIFVTAWKSEEIVDKMMELHESLSKKHEPITRAQMAEVVRLMRLIPRAKRVALHFMPPNLDLRNAQGEGFPVHTANAPFTFEIELEDGSTMTLNIEHGAVEINKPPCRIRNMAQTWKPLMDLLNQNGFTGSLEKGWDGGGGHVHMGFRNNKQNLFLMEPRILSELLLMPLNNPGVLYGLSETAEHGLDSTAKTHVFSSPSYEKGLKISKARSSELLKAMRRLNQMSAYPWRENRRQKAIVDFLPSFLFDHESYVSLKSFSSYLHRVRAELRIPRAFNSYEDLRALGHFVFECLVRFHSTPVRTELSEKDFIPPHSMSLRPLRRQFSGFLNQLALSFRDRRRLLKFGGANVFELSKPEFIRSTSWSHRIQIAEHPHAAGDLPIYDLLLPRKFRNTWFTDAAISGTLAQVPQTGSRFSISLPTFGQDEALYLVSLWNSEQKPPALDLRIRLRHLGGLQYEVEIEGPSKEWEWNDADLETLALTRALSNSNGSVFALQLNRFSSSQLKGAANWTKFQGRYEMGGIHFVLNVENIDSGSLSRTSSLEKNDARSDSVKVAEIYGALHMMIFGKKIIEELRKNDGGAIDFKDAEGNKLISLKAGLALDD